MSLFNSNRKNKTLQYSFFFINTHKLYSHSKMNNCHREYNVLYLIDISHLFNLNMFWHVQEYKILDLTPDTVPKQYFLFITLNISLFIIWHSRNVEF